MVAFLLYMDYLFHKYDTHLVYSGNKISLGNSFMYIALVVIIFFAGFRYEIGYDYTKYFSAYLTDSELQVWEPLFVFFVRVLRHVNFGLDIQGMFLFFSALTVFIVYKALKNITPYYRFGLLLYLLVPSYFLNSFSVIRQGIAIALLLYALQYITKDKNDYKRYMFVALIAFLFHYSSIFVSFVYVFGAVFFNKIYSWVVYLLLILLSLFISLTHSGKYFISVMPGHFSVYADLTYDISPIKLLVVNFFFLFLLYHKDEFVKEKLARYLFNSMFIGLVIFNVFSDFVYVSRLAQYFLIAEIILIPMYLYSIKNIFNRTVMIIIFLLYYIAIFNFSLYKEKSSHEGYLAHMLIPYKNYFFEESKSYRTIYLEAWYNYIQENSMNQENEDNK